ncbi:hypothetical protein TNCV_856201 [Trichonephila clavipes]|nr:hypothetical protein TNCV_856201 [Trichonephila clavipes]
MAEAVREAVDENDGKRDLLLLLMVAGRSVVFLRRIHLVTVTSVDTGKVIDRLSATETALFATSVTRAIGC